MNSNINKIDFLFTRNRCRAEAGNKADIDLIKKLLEKGYSAGMVSSCDRIHAELEKDGIFSIQLFKEIGVPSMLENIADRARRIENEYGIPSLKRFIFSEKCYYNEDENHLFKKAIVYFEWLEKFFDRTEVKCLINAQGGQIDIRAFYCIAKKRGIPIIFLGESLFPDKMLLFADEMKNLCNFKDIGWKEMNSQQKEEIEEHIRQFKERRGIYIHSFLFNKKDEIERSFLTFKEYIKNKKFQALKIVIFKKLKELVSKNFNRLLSNFIYQREIKDENFVFFPSHIADDSQITMRNPQFYKQAVLAVHIARSLPFGYKLYIKEHPGHLLSVGNKIDFLREKNITLLYPGLNSHKIIEKSKAVTIINSTVGFEAFYYFKPVVVIGNWHLKGRGITVDGQDLFKLDEAIRYAINQKVDQNKIKSFLFSLKESMYDGSIMTPDMNYDKVADTIIKRYKELGFGR